MSFRARKQIDVGYKHQALDVGLVPCFYLVGSLDKQKVQLPMGQNTAGNSISSNLKFSDLAGDFGRWQLIVFLFVSMVKIPAAWHMLVSIFRTPATDFWCVRPPELMNLPVQKWINISHPVMPSLSGSWKRDRCHIRDMNYSKLIETGFDNITLEPEKNISLQPCINFEYSPRTSKLSVISQWNLVCRRHYLVALSQIVYLSGVLVGGIICSQLLKARFSPKKLLLGGVICQVAGGLGSIFILEFELFIVFRFLIAISCTHMFTCACIICTDIVSGKWKVIIGSSCEYMWSLGVISLAVIAWYINSWKTLQIILSAPSVVFLLFFWLIPEMPQWLLLNGQKQEAQKIAVKAAYWNSRKVPEHTNLETLSPEDDKKVEASILDLFRQPASKSCTCCLFVAWTATVVTYYGGLVNVKSLGSRIYTNTAVAGGIEIAGVMIGTLLLLKSKQLWLWVGGLMVIGGSASIATCAFPEQDFSGEQWTLLSLAMAGRLAVAASLTVLQVETPSMLPPSVRQIGMTSFVTFARICFVSAPLLSNLASYDVCLPLIIFGAITVLGGIAELILHTKISEEK